MTSHLLSAIVFLPLAGAAVCALVPSARASRALALVTSGMVLALTVWLVAAFDPHAGMQFVERARWIPQIGSEYHLGVDGMSLPMLALSALLSVLAVVASWNVAERPKTYFALLMLLEVGMNGVFVALDFVLFYVFWELVLVPMYFLIAWWGGPRRQYASLKFFLYTLFGSVFMLVGIIALYLHPAGGTLDMVALAGRGFPERFQMWVFAAFFLGFAVKVPVFPLHTWLPDAHVEAPTAASVLLAGILLKMGTYGFIRAALPILPEASRAWAPVVAALAAISIVYGAALAFAQTDLKKLVAYSSVSHMGFVMLGIAAGTPEGISGAVAVMFSHGVVTGMLFLLVGMVYERTHTRMIEDVSGLSVQVPVAGGLLAFASFASLGLPGLSGFVGEFLSLLGAWKSALVPSGWVIVSAVGVLLAAAYMLTMVQRVVLGEPSEAVAGIADLTLREIGVLVPLAALTLTVGVWWDSLLRYVAPAAAELAQKVMGS
ncbi:NADH-quinone oxidoreductase subunit M [Coriobacteriia bacterium Es71-Z0120]|uniref:complex I subunit 4 family protein n=1 Tax=Parvivirga hydrogeniphila TaxID=2939460 RepID=UPI002260F358|nr:NADH-quinone oxidoreductase subunit M [Parvivirga hydrogeniphila]MCL4079287.1 NADH-quinone oxidoreductase subunit M [Parvivirga hydrogeniphila]